MRNEDQWTRFRSALYPELAGRPDASMDLINVLAGSQGVPSVVALCDQTMVRSPDLGVVYSPACDTWRHGGFLPAARRQRWPASRSPLW